MVARILQVKALGFLFFSCGVNGLKIDMRTEREVAEGRRIKISSDSSSKQVKEDDLVAVLEASKKGQKDARGNYNEGIWEDRLPVNVEIGDWENNQGYSDSEDEDKERIGTSAISSLPPVSTRRVKNAGQSGYKLATFNITKKRPPKSIGKKKINNYVVNLGQIDYLRRSLAQDALQIAASDHSGLEHTTILCVALMNSKQRIKKFAFHNHGQYTKWRKAEAEDPSFKEKRAYELGYHIIQSEVSHAEGQFLQFLYQRCKSNPGYYTHIIGMGRSRRHCLECDALLKLVLGQSYKRLTAIINLGALDAISIQPSTPPELPILVVKRNFSVITEDPEQLYKPEKSSNFRIPTLLRAVIEKQIGQSVNISGSRYTNPD